jgi:hypothetical protein
LPGASGRIVTNEDPQNGVGNWPVENGGPSVLMESITVIVFPLIVAVVSGGTISVCFKIKVTFARLDAGAG